MKINRFFQAHPPTPSQQKEILDQKMRGAAKDYEKYFLDQMVKAMRKTVPDEKGLIQKNFAEKLYSENLDQEYVKNWSEAGGVGLSDLIYQQLKEQVEALSGGPAQALPKEGPMPLKSEGNKLRAIQAYKKVGRENLDE